MRGRKQRLALAAALLAFSLAGAAGASAQQGTGRVTGRVTDAGNLKPLASAQVFIAGTSRGTLTNADGRYVIELVPAGPRTVRVTVLGYAEGSKAVTVTAGGAETADFALAQSAVELNAVVVSAVTGTKERRAEIGANVTNISVDQINKGQVTSVQDVLNGRTAGIDLHATSGSVGASQKIRIRGANSLSLSNEPLVYVDGIAYKTDTGTGFGVGGQDVSRLNDLNPEDIANIEVLKGPAASALYGTAAANGVLLITTKRGRAGKPTWKAFAETGSLEDKTNYPINFLAYSLAAGATPGAPMTTSTGGFNSAARTPCYNYQAAAGTCRQDSVMTFNSLRDPRTGPFVTGFRNNFGGSVSGGTDAARYYISGDVQREQGVISFNTNRMVNLRSNLDTQLRPNLDLSVSAAYTTGSLERNNNDNSVFSPLINGYLGGAFYYPRVANAAGDSVMNPRNFGFNYGINDLSYLPTFQDVNHFILGSNSNYRPFSWLSANASVGLDLDNLHEYDTLQPNSPLGSLAPSYMIGFRESRQSDDLTYTGNASGTASFDLRPDLNSSTTVGGSYQKNHLYSTYGVGYGIVSGTANLGATSSLKNVAEDFSEVVTLGAFVQEKLAYKDRLFLSGSVRTDNNSAFGTRFGWVRYPALSASWLVSQEPFFPKYSWLSSLRLRTAWGTSGLRPNFRQAVTYYGPVATTVAGANLSSVTLSATGNDNLKPERTTEYEFGGDLGLLSDRVSAEFTYYKKRSRDALISKPLPPSLGLTGAQFDNLGSVQNQGLEMALNALVLNSENTRLNVRLAATTLANKVISLGTVLPYSMTRGNQKMVPGYTIAGYWQKPYTFADSNGDGLISPSEVHLLNPAGSPGDTTQFIGPVLPTFTRSLSADLTVLKYITISTLFDWRGGNYQSNQTESFRCQSMIAKGERGCEENMDPHASLAEQARFVAYRYLGTYWGFDEKADFVKWRELSLTLGAPAFLTEHMGWAKGASLTLAGRNLHTWTKYSGVDPEVNEIGSTAGTTGGFIQDEFNTQPPLRLYTARLNFTF